MQIFTDPLIDGPIFWMQKTCDLQRFQVVHLRVCGDGPYGSARTMTIWPLSLMHRARRHGEDHHLLRPMDGVNRLASLVGGWKTRLHWLHLPKKKGSNYEPPSIFVVDIRRLLFWSGPVLFQKKVGRVFSVGRMFIFLRSGNSSHGKVVTSVYGDFFIAELIEVPWERWDGLVGKWAGVMGPRSNLMQMQMYVNFEGFPLYCNSALFGLVMPWKMMIGRQLCFSKEMVALFRGIFREVLLFGEVLLREGDHPEAFHGRFQWVMFFRNLILQPNIS